MSKKSANKSSTGLNLSEFDQTSHGFLNKEVEVKKDSKTTKVLKEKKLPKEEVEQDKEESKKLGRPMFGDEPLNKKLGVSLTEREYQKILDDAALVPVSAYVRDRMKEAKII